MRGHMPAMVYIVMVNRVVAILVTAGSHLLLPCVPIVTFPSESSRLPVASEMTSFGLDGHIASLVHWLSGGQAAERGQSGLCIVTFTLDQRVHVSVIERFVRGQEARVAGAPDRNHIGS